MNVRTDRPRIGATVVIVEPGSAPMIGQFIGIDLHGRAQVQRAIGGAWAGDATCLIF